MDSLRESKPQDRAAQRLREIETLLRSIYDLVPETLVQQHLCSREQVEAMFGEEAHSLVARGELLVVHEEPGTTPEVGLYLSETSLASLATEHNMHHLAPVYEGVSHLVYLSFRSDFGDSVSELELELQAEVDKYVLSLFDTAHMMEGNGVHAFRGRSKTLRSQLFEHVSFRDEAHTERGRRYREANQLAYRYTRYLEQSFLQRGDAPGLRSELRRFYRAGLREKVELSTR